MIHMLNRINNNLAFFRLFKVLKKTKTKAIKTYSSPLKLIFKVSVKTISFVFFLSLLFLGRHLDLRL